MNDDELRDHLRAAVAPVRGTPPPVGALRASRRRHTRAARLVGVGLSVVVLGWVGIGVAVAAHDGSGGTAVAVATPSPVDSAAPRGVVVGCTSATVTLAVGQTLTVTGCPAQAEYVVGDPTVVARAAGDPHFLAAAVGTTTIGLGRRAVCNGGTCPDFVEALGTVTVTVVPGRPAALRPAAVDVPCGGATTVVLGQTLTLTGCDHAISASASAPLEQHGSFTFRALGIGRATVDVAVETDCQRRGGICPAVARVTELVVYVVAPTDVVGSATVPSAVCTGPASCGAAAPVTVVVTAAP